MSHVALPFSAKLVGLKRVPPSAADAGSVEDTARERIDRLREGNRVQLERHAAEQELTRALLDAFAGLQSEMAARLDATRDWVLEVALGLASHVLEREIEDGRYDLGDVLRESLANALGSQAGVEIAVSAIDEAFVQQWLQGQRDELGALASSCAVRVDPSLAPGACRVSTAIGQIVHSPLEALARAAERVREGLAS